MKTNKFLLTALFLMPFFVLAENQPKIEKTVNFNAAVRKCAKNIDADTFQAIARTESSFNQFAIGVVKGRLLKQPTNLAEAIAAVQTLRKRNYNFSMGLVQINKQHMDKFGLTDESVFDICTNLRVGGEILKDCFAIAKGNEQQRLQQALSCYYSGNFRTGFKSSDNYVKRVVDNAKLNKSTQIINPPKAMKKNKTKQQMGVPKIDTSVPVPSIEMTKVSTPKQAKKTKQTEITVSDNQNTEQMTESKHPRAEWDVFGDWCQF